jgi:hypothetical protein
LVRGVASPTNGPDSQCREKESVSLAGLHQHPGDVQRKVVGKLKNTSERARIAGNVNSLNPFFAHIVGVEER